jgi:hypothetical protein
MTLSSVAAALLLDSDGNRILTKYYTCLFQTQKEQKSFERSIYDKTRRAPSELFLFLF